MKVLALIENADHVCYRYRLNALAWAMAEQGLCLEGAPIEKALGARLRQLLAVGHADVVILQRKLLPSWQLALLRRRAKCLVYDVDDALFHRDSFVRKSTLSRVRLARFRKTVRAADAVIAGNDYLRQYASAYTDPWRVHWVPTCVQPQWYRPATHNRMGRAVRLVWIGQRSMLPSLECLREHFAAIARWLPDMHLRLVCDAATEFPGLRVGLRRWSTATEAEDLADADIGISWLPDDLWSQGKCGLKVLQYMAAGLPVVANPVGIHRQMVVHGETGLLAATPSQWAAAIARLAADPRLRSRMGAAGRQRVKEQYNVEHWGPRLASVVDSVARGRGARLPRAKAHSPSLGESRTHG